MGACLSGNQSSSQQTPSNSASKWRNCSSSSTSSSTTPTTVPTPVATASTNASSRGGGMRDGENRLSTRNNPTTATPNNQDSSSFTTTTTTTPSSSSIKGDKKNFYSRIPPLGRVGSDHNKGGGGAGGGTNKANITAGNNAIKDNNNAYSESKIAALFECYKDPFEDAVGAEGIERLCKDLEVKPEDFKMLVLAWKFDAEQMCRFSRQEFFQGMKALGTDTLPGIQARLPDLVTQVHSDPLKFKDLYRFSFKFGLDSELNQRILPLDMATSLWRLVFSQKEPPLLERWISFLESSPGIRGIPKDTWEMFLHLVTTVGADLSNYDDTEAWPSLFDDFVEFENDATNQNTISNSSPKNHQQQAQQQHTLNQRLSPH